MASIAVVHPDLTVRGGAEDVCAHVLQTLQREHRLTLITATDPNIDELNEYFGTDIGSLDIDRSRGLSSLYSVGGSTMQRLKSSVLGRYARRRCDLFDLVISTKNEYGLATPNTPSIEYVHSPRFAAADPGIDRISIPRTIYNAICRSTAGFDADDLARSNTTLLANSNWTAGVINRIYGQTAETVYPPVHVDEFAPKPWSDRENGFVTIGRVGPSKRILENIEVVRKVRERNHDVHLHIAGPVGDASYAKRVRKRAKGCSFVTVEGAVSRDRLVEIITSHRYGLHGRPFEHFGIAVAEMVAGGTIPFIPETGGQGEIVGDIPQLLYETPPEAVENIMRVLSDESLQHSLRRDLSERSEVLSSERFATEIGSVVSTAVNGS